MMHATRPYEYFEDAFLAWLERTCGGYEALRAGGVDLVVTESACSHARPARLGDLIDVAVRPAAAGERSFTVEIAMTRGRETIATGRVTYVTLREGKPSAIPASLRSALAGPPEPRPKHSRAG